MDFSLSPRVEDLRDRIAAFMAEHVEPVEEEALRALDDEVRPGIAYPRVLVDLRERAKAEGLWNLFLANEHDGVGLTNWEYGVRWLTPLLEGEIRSCFSMTEPERAGSDPTNLATRAERDGDEWVIDGHEWFTSGAVGAEVAIVMAVTDPDAPPHRRASMILVPLDAPGFNLVRPVSVMGHDGGPGHCEIRYEGCRVPASNLLGEQGRGFAIAQDRLGPGRIHHCMRAIGGAERALELMCERAIEREAFGGPLADKQFVQDFIAKSRIEIDGARLMVLHAAWKMDTEGKRAARQEISMIKVVAANVVMDVLDRAIQVHGALGVSDDTPLAALWRSLRMLRLADGPDEVHKMVIAVRELNRWRDAPELPAFVRAPSDSQAVHT